jgi:hypothetical protein
MCRDANRFSLRVRQLRASQLRRMQPTLVCFKITAQSLRSSVGVGQLRSSC